MEHLVRFKSLTQDFSSENLKAMACQLIDNDGENWLMKMIWSHAYLQYRSNKSSCFIQKINAIASEIKLKQEIMHENTESESDARVHIHDISNEIISKIGTFLELRDVAKMERVHRRFFVSLRYPSPALQHMEAHILKRYDPREKESWIVYYFGYCERTGLPLNFDRFRRVLNLMYLTEDDIDFYAKYFRGAFRSSVSQIYLQKASFKLLEESLHSAYSTFNPEIIRTLRLNLDVRYGWCETECRARDFKQILYALENMECFDIKYAPYQYLSDATVVPYWSDFQQEFESIMASEDKLSDPKQLLPKLKIFGTHWPSRVSNTILRASACQLQSLTLHRATHDICQFPQLSNLVELYLDCSDTCLRRYLDAYGWSQMPNLKRLSVNSSENSSENTYDDFMSAMDCIFKNINLEYIGIRRFFALDTRLKFLQALTVHLGVFKRQTLTLRMALKHTREDEFCLSDVAELAQLIQTMKTYICDGFSLILDCCCFPWRSNSPNVKNALTESGFESEENLLYYRTHGFEEHQWLYNLDIEVDKENDLKRRGRRQRRQRF